MLWFTCYDPDTDEILALGNAQECAEGLGLSAASFYNYICRSRTKRSCPYTFVIENTRTGGMVTLHAVKEELPTLSPGLRPDRPRSLGPHPWERAC